VTAQHNPGTAPPRRCWLIIANAFNMDGRAASQTITDKMEPLMQRGILPLVVSARTGKADTRFPHRQVSAIAPSGLKFDLRHILRMRFGDTPRARLLKNLAQAGLLPFYAVERLLVRRESQWSWFIRAQHAGAAFIRDYPVELIYSSGGAESAHRAALNLKRRFKLPWLAEIHDPLLYEGIPVSAQNKRYLRRLEQRIARHADAAWWFTEKALERARERTTIGERGHAIIPGVREPAFAQVRYRRRERLVLAHFGSLAPTRNLAGFAHALARFLESEPAARGKITVALYGGKPDRITQTAIDSHGLTGTFTLHGRLEHDPATGTSGRTRVLQAMRQADVLLMPQGHTPFSEEYIPSKFYEYAWARRPILALTGHNPQLQAMLERGGHWIAPDGDAAATTRCIHEIWQAWQNDALTDRLDAPVYRVEDAVERILALAGSLPRTPPAP